MMNRLVRFKSHLARGAGTLARFIPAVRPLGDEPLKALGAHGLNQG
jgi:hypothetical protein